MRSPRIRPLFGRKRPRGRLDVGRFEAPERREPPPVDAIVEEGLLLALSAVRMAVKNRIIIGALREGEDYVELLYQAASTEELLSLAREKDDESRRMTAELGEFGAPSSRPAGAGGVGSPDQADRERAQLRRREAVSRGLATRLRSVSTDPEVLAAVVEAARDAAWHEIAVSIRQLLARRAEVDSGSPDYVAERDTRLRELIRVDLAALADRATPTY